MFMHILGIRIKNNAGRKLDALVRSVEVVYPIWRHADKLRWKLNKSLMRNNTLRWLSLSVSCDWITGVTSGPMASQHLKCWFGVSETPESKCVIRMIWFNSLRSVSHTRVCSRTPASERQRLLCFVWRSRHTRLWWREKEPDCRNLQFYYWYSAPISQEVMVLFSWTHGMEKLLYSQMFYAIFRVKFWTLNGSI